LTASQSSGSSLGDNPQKPAGLLDLCTKTSFRGAPERPARYKTGSAPKWLIRKEFCSGPFFAAERQALDFSGPARQHGQDVNKVIHKYGVQTVNGCEIKHLAAVPDARLKV
jgi:hypothetical protein